jgi:hypothetical protein
MRRENADNLNVLGCENFLEGDRPKSRDAERHRWLFSRFYRGLLGCLEGV